jgi:hypothetical protein
LGLKKLDQMTETIFVALLDEGTDVWRPVQAELVEGSLYRIIGPAPEDELWEFTPGSLVRCREKVFSGGERGLVAYERG